MIIPPVKVVEAGRIVDDVFRLILAQIRSKHETAGDFRAQFAANVTGVRRIQALAARHGRDTLAATMQELLEYTERRVRAEIAALPHGVYEAEGTVDNDGYTDEPVHLRARVEIGADGLRFDTSGSDPQRRGAGQLDLRADVLRLRVCAQVPDRPGPARQRRLLPALPGRRTRGNGDELHVARRRSSAAGRRRRASSR